MLLGHPIIIFNISIGKLNDTKDYEVYCFANRMDFNFLLLMKLRLDIIKLSADKSLKFFWWYIIMKQLLRCHSDKESSCQCRSQVWSLGKKDPLEQEMAPYSFLSGKFLGQRSLTGYSPCDHKESDTVEWLSPHHALWNRREGGRTQTSKEWHSHVFVVLSLSHVQLLATLCMDSSPQSSSVHGILQERILDWVAISRYRI